MPIDHAVWVFNGDGSFPSAVFSELEIAEEWIRRNAVSGTLTQYPLNIGIYEWTIANGFIKPKREAQTIPSFIAGFSSAYQEHYHYENGECVS